MERQRNARVAVLALAVLGLRWKHWLAALTLVVDDDKVCPDQPEPPDLYRKTVGKYKVDVAEGTSMISADPWVNTYKTFYMPNTADQFDSASTTTWSGTIDTVKGLSWNWSYRRRQQARHHQLRARATNWMLPPWKLRIFTIPPSARWPSIMRAELRKRGVNTSRWYTQKGLH